MTKTRNQRRGERRAKLAALRRAREEWEASLPGPLWCRLSCVGNEDCEPSSPCMRCVDYRFKWMRNGVWVVW